MWFIRILYSESYRRDYNKSIKKLWRRKNLGRSFFHVWIWLLVVLLWQSLNKRKRLRSWRRKLAEFLRTVVTMVFSSISAENGAIPTAHQNQVGIKLTEELLAKKIKSEILKIV